MNAFLGHVCTFKSDEFKFLQVIQMRQPRVVDLGILKTKAR